MELSPEIILDDIEVLREELAERLALARETYLEVSRRMEEARKQGIEV